MNWEMRGWVRTGSAGGFALVLVLGAVMLLALLAGTLGFLVERQAEGREELEALVRARAAALAAVERARGHLQQLAGDDRRVTATVGLVDATEEGRRGVAGVWEVEPAATPFRGWLVDGAPRGETGSDPRGVVPESTGTPGVDDVIVLGSGSVGATRDRVLATLQLQPGAGAVGGGAGVGERQDVRTTYVVFDEGVKASLQTVPQEPVGPGGMGPNGASLTADDAALRWAWARVARGSGLDLLFPGLVGTASELHARKNRIFLRSQVRLLDPAITAARLRSHFHDATLLSRGVLASTAWEHPGLRTNWADPGAIREPEVAEALGLQAPGGGALPLRRTLAIGSGPLARAWLALGPTLVEASLWLGLVTREREESVDLGLRYETRIALWNAGAVTRTVDAGGLEVVWHGLPRLRVVIAESGLAVFNGALPPEATRAVNDARVVWSPGDLVLLRGGGRMAESGSPATAWWPALPRPAGTSGAGGLQLDAVSADESLTAEIRVGGAWLATLRAGHGFAAVDAETRHEGGEADAVWIAAYGAVAVGPPGQDPRLPRLVGEELARSARWTNDPQANARTGVRFAPDVLPRWANGVQWDLPAEPIASVLGLRGIVIGEGGALGAPAGTGINRVFDEIFLAPALADGATAEPGRVVAANPFLERRDPAAGAGWRSPGSAADFWIRGAFNVNATSVPAWSTVLRAALDAEGLAGVEGFRVPRGEGSGEARAQALRARAPAVARAVVSRLRARGRPFRSVAEWVDSGIVEAAIAEAGLNDGLAADQLDRPGWVNQADLLVRVAPRWVARSDTFLVRAYAEVRDTRTRRLLARVWGEATLQRMPEAAARSDSGREDDGARERRCEIVDFRWLLPSEV